MAIKPFQSDLTPIGHFDFLDSELADVQGGEIVVFDALPANTADKRSPDIFDQEERTLMRLANSLDDGPFFLAQVEDQKSFTSPGFELTSLYATNKQFGQTFDASGKIGIFGQEGFYSVNSAVVDSTTVNDTTTVGQRLYTSPEGQLTTTVSASGAIVGFFVEFQDGDVLRGFPNKLRYPGTHAEGDSIIFYKTGADGYVNLDFIAEIAGQVSVIGSPTDGYFSDGYHTFSSTTRTADAVDALNESTLDLYGLVSASSMHGLLSGLTADDHPQYFNTARLDPLLDGYATDTDLATHTGDATIHFTEASIDHGSIAGLGDDDHTQYLLADASRLVSGNLRPSVDDTHDLGSPSLRWKDGYFGPGTLFLGSTGAEATISYDAATDSLVLNGGGETSAGSALLLPEQTVSPSDISGFGKLFAKDDGYVYFRNDAGQEFNLTTDTGAIVHGALGGLGSDDHPQYFNTGRLEPLLDGYTTDAEFSAHTGDATIHFTEASIHHGSVAGLGDDDHPQYFNDARLQPLLDGYVHSGDAAGGDLSGTYPNPAVSALTETSGPTQLVLGDVEDGYFLKRVGSTFVGAPANGGSGVSDHGLLTGLPDDDHLQYFNAERLEPLLDGYTTDAEFSSHTSDATIHFTEASIHHGGIGGLGDDDHPQYFNSTRLEPLLDGYATDAELSAHTGNSTIHFTVASIDHGAIAGLGDDDHPQYFNVTRLEPVIDGYVHTGDSAGGDLSGTYPNPVVSAITETSGPTSLVAGAISDGYVFQRVGATIVGLDPGLDVVNLTTVTSNHTINAVESVILVDATAGNLTVTMPTMTSGRRLSIKKIDSTGNTITVAPNTSEQIENDTDALITSFGESLTFVGDGSDWWVI